MAPSTRLLTLLALLQSRRFWPGGELSDALGATSRTLRRDVASLRELGYEVEATSGPGGGYRFGRGASLPPLLLGEEEAVLLAATLRASLQSATAERLLPVFAKLDQLLPERLRARVAALHEQTVVLGARGAAPVDPARLATLAAACRDSDLVRLRYRARDGDAGERSLVPLRLVHTGNRRWYLVGWDVGREAWRTLRVDRVEAIVSVGSRTPRPPAPPDLEGYVADALAAAPYPCRGTFEIEGDLAELRRRVPPWIGVLTQHAPGRCRLVIGAGDWDSVVQLSLGCRAPFRVVDPPELLEATTRLAERLAAAVP